MDIKKNVKNGTNSPVEKKGTLHRLKYLLLEGERKTVVFFLHIVLQDAYESVCSKNEGKHGSSKQHNRDKS